MQYFKQTLLFLAIIMLLSGCKETPKTLPAESATEQYTSAVAVLEAAECFSMDISIERDLQYGKDTYTEVQKKSVTLYSPGKEDFQALSTGTVQYGQHQLVTEEIYRNGNLYLTLNDNLMCSAYTQDQYMEALPPITLLDPGLYQQITSQSVDRITTISLNAPTQAEVWALPKGAALDTASASVQLDSQGHLLFASYDLSYHRDTVTERYSVKVNYNILSSFEAPQFQEDAYAPVSNIHAPIALEKAYAMLLQSTHVNGRLTHSIYSEASSIHYDSSSAVTRHGDTAQIETTITLEDPSRGGDTSTLTQVECYENGIYTISRDTEQTEQQMDADQFFSYCMNLLSQNILSSGYVIDCTQENLNGSILLTFYADDVLAEKICENACMTIYQDPTFLDSRSSDYLNDLVIYRITVDPLSGLPLTCDMDYSATHTIEQLDYLLETHYRQTYTYG